MKRGSNAVCEGTLIRMIPLDVKWEGYTSKYRIETGDLGKAIGTVQYEPTNGWHAYAMFDSTYRADLIEGGPWAGPEFASLALFAAYMTHLADHVPLAVVG